MSNHGTRASGSRSRQPTGEPIGRRNHAGVAEATPLTKREREITGMLAEGASGAEIAERLVLSPETVRTHIRNAMSKLNASSRAHAVALAVQRGEIDWPLAAADDEQFAPVTTAGRRARGRPGSAPPAQPRTDAMLTALAAGTASLYDVDGGGIFLAEEDGLSLRRVAVAGNRDLADRNRLPDRLQLGKGPLGRAALQRRALIVNEWESEMPVQGHATICAPMIVSGNLVGVICLMTRPSRLVGRGELLLLQAFASRLGEVLQLPVAEQQRGLKSSFEKFRDSWAATSA